MQTQAALTVSGADSSDVEMAVQSFFGSMRRFRRWTWLPHDRAMIAGGSVSSGKVPWMQVDVDGSIAGRTRLAVTSNTYPLFDWGETRRSIKHLVRALEQSGLQVEVN
jgi:hypothetical protein